MLWILVLGPLFFSVAAAPSPPPAPRLAAPAADVRFATRFCYRQHNNQTDVMACLLRYLHR